jgi:hypothetical protein
VREELGLVPKRYVVCCPVSGVSVAIKSVPEPMTLDVARHLVLEENLQLIFVGV